MSRSDRGGLAQLHVHFFPQAGFPIPAGIVERQDHVEITAREVDFVIALALHPDPPAVRLDDALRERQSQPGAAALETGLAGGMLGEVARLVELAEDDILGSRLHAHAGIAHGDLDSAIGQFGAVRGQHASRHRHLTIVRRELDRIRQQVLEEFLEQVGVSLGKRQGRDVDRQRLLAFDKRFLQFIADGLDHAGSIHRRQVDL